MEKKLTASELLETVGVTRFFDLHMITKKHDSMITDSTLRLIAWNRIKWNYCYRFPELRTSKTSRMNKTEYK